MFTEGATEGATESATEGTTEGTTEGATEGATERATEGATEGTTEGATEGITEGATEGITEADGMKAACVDGMPHRDIEHRTFRFALEIARLCDSLTTRGPVIRRLSYQLLDAGTSVGTNTEEAVGAQSHADFIAKCAVVRKESRETRFWLRLLAALDPRLADSVGPHATEAGELVAIFNAMIKTARSRRRKT